MNIDVLLALAVFCLVSSITPGPNNLMLLSSGINFGFRRSIGHLSGVVVGFVLMLFLVGVGVSQVFELYPSSYTLLKYVSVAYLTYLAYKIANSKGLSAENNKDNPITFNQAVLFQWVNPKAWTMAVSANSVYAPDQSIGAVLWVSLVFFICNLPAVSLWLVAGQSMKTWLSDPIKLKVFNVLMAGLLVASFIPMLD